jgi:hypothetical protein
LSHFALFIIVLSRYFQLHQIIFWFGIFWLQFPYDVSLIYFLYFKTKFNYWVFFYDYNLLASLISSSSNSLWRIIRYFRFISFTILRFKKQFFLFKKNLTKPECIIELEFIIWKWVQFGPFSLICHLVFMSIPNWNEYHSHLFLNIENHVNIKWSSFLNQ